jgi:hypothetical protein
MPDEPIWRRPRLGHDHASILVSGRTKMELTVQAEITHHYSSP